MFLQLDTYVFFKPVLTSILIDTYNYTFGPNQIHWRCKADFFNQFIYLLLCLQFSNILQYLHDMINRGTLKAYWYAPSKAVNVMWVIEWPTCWLWEWDCYYCMIEFFYTILKWGQLFRGHLWWKDLVYKMMVVIERWSFLRGWCHSSKETVHFEIFTFTCFVICSYKLFNSRMLASM